MYHVQGFGKGGVQEGGLLRWEGKTGRRGEAASVIIHNTFAFDVATVIFPPVCLNPAREQLQDHSNTAEKILNQCFRQLLKATSGESERKRKICTSKQSLSPSTPPLHFHPSFAFFLSLFSLLTTVIVSFSLSKNIAFLPRCKGGEISTRVLPFHLRGGERNLGGNQVS